VVAVNLWFFDHPAESGIYNLGTGQAQPFNDVAITVVNTLREQRGENPLSLEQAVAAGLIEYIAFPQALRGKYQSYTQADLNALRSTGCDHTFANVQSGVRAYVQALAAIG
jgi:ADP-L-glycero-D-manno-heptose 6-epimerase